MDILSIIISFLALGLSGFAIGRQIYIERKTNKPSLIVDYSFGHQVKKKSKNDQPIRHQFIKVDIINLGKKAIFIEIPLLCISTGLLLHKRFKETFDYVDYPKKLEPGERFTTGIELLKREEDGQYHLSKGDFLADGPPRKFKLKNDSPSAFIEVKDTKGNVFISKEFYLDEFFEKQEDLEKLIN